MRFHPTVLAVEPRHEFRWKGKLVIAGFFDGEHFFIYRGYPIERVEELTGYKWLASLVSVLVFILAHVAYWGGAQLIVVGFGAVILALLYLWRRDLICNMIAHFLVDLVGFLAAGASRRPSQ